MELRSPLEETHLRRRTPRRWITVAASLIVLTALGGWALSSWTGGSPAPAPSRIAAVERGTVTRSVVATGRVEPITKVEIKSKANGIIERLFVNVDDVVAAGQVLAELDKEALAARLRETLATLQAAEASYEGALAQLRKSTVEAEAPDVALARRNLDRALSLFKQQLLAAQALDEATTTLQQAENRQRAAAGQLAIAEARVAEAKANVAQARALVERAREELANATIRAPISATVLTRNVEIGSPVSSILNLGANATVVMTLGDVNRVFVRGRVDEADISVVRIGQRAAVTTQTFPDRSFDGRVTRIAPIGETREGVTTFEVEVALDNTAGALRPNMTANAEIILEERANALTVPEAAVGFDQKRNPYVELVDPSSPTGRRRVPVKIGVTNGSRIELLGGVTEGQQVLLPG
jgi:HlyD family secretion protein